MEGDIQMLSLEEMKKMLIEAAVELKDKELYFCKLDSAAGDGDHGLTIARMADAVKAMAESDQSPDIRTFLDNVSAICMGINGGSAGPLWGTIFEGMSEGAPEGKKEVSEDELKAMFKRARSDFEDISRAKAGDKTMADALYPAVDAAIAAKGGISEIMDAAAAAAVDGAAKTSDYVAKFGRAKNLGTQSIGHVDPGAVSLSVLLDSMAKALH